MLSPQRIPPNNHKRRRKISNREHDLERPQLTSKEVKRPQMKSKESSPIIETVKPNTSQKRKLKGEGNIEINDECLDEILHNNNLQMDLALQIISNAKTVRSNTVQDLKEFNSQSSSTQAKKGVLLVSIKPAIWKAFELMSDDIVELSTENESLKNKIGSYDKKWLEESEAKLLKQIDDEKRANLLFG